MARQTIRDALEEVFVAQQVLHRIARLVEGDGTAKDIVTDVTELLVEEGYIDGEDEESDS